MSNISRRQDQGLGKTAAGGSGGSFASHERGAASPPPAVAQYRSGQQNRKLRGHDFYPSEKQMAQIPKLYETDDTVVGAAGKICYARYFSPAGEFLVTEIDQGTGESFGIYKNQYGETELTYFDLPHAEQVKAVSNGMPAIYERDLHFEVQRAGTALPEDYGGRAADRLNRESYKRLEAAYGAYQEQAKKALAPDFNAATDIETYSERTRELMADLVAVEAELGVHLHTDHDHLDFKRLRSTNRGDWVDTKLNEIRTGAK